VGQRPVEVTVTTKIFISRHRYSSTSNPQSATPFRNPVRRACWPDAAPTTASQFLSVQQSLCSARQTGLNWLASPYCQARSNQHAPQTLPNTTCCARYAHIQSAWLPVSWSKPSTGWWRAPPGRVNPSLWQVMPRPPPTWVVPVLRCRHQRRLLRHSQTWRDERQAATAAPPASAWPITAASLPTCSGLLAR